tara:strand:- start:805 stop:1635 length:831 start_codon:yes stop_codon:yes gene_type:complete
MLIEPYAEIEKKPLVYDDNRAISNGYGVTIKTTDNEKQWQEIGIVSPNYLLVPNKQVKDMADEIIDASDYNFTPHKTFWNGKQYMTSYSVEDHDFGEVTVGDPITLGLMVQNSYDQSWVLSISLFAIRKLCNNGMTSRVIFPMRRFKHDNMHTNWEIEMRQTINMLAQAGSRVKEVIQYAQYLNSKILSIKVLKEFRQKHLQALPVSKFGRVIDKFLSIDNKRATAWDFLNAGTYIFWHNEKQTATDFKHNELLTTKLLLHARDSAKEWNGGNVTA